MSEQKPTTPEELMQQIMDENPDADNSALRELFAREAMERLDIMRAITASVTAGWIKEFKRPRN